MIDTTQPPDHAIDGGHVRIAALHAFDLVDGPMDVLNGPIDGRFNSDQTARVSVALWLTRKVTGCSYPQLALAVHKESHTYIFAQCRSIDTKALDPFVGAMLDGLEKALRERTSDIVESAFERGRAAGRRGR